MRFEIDTSGDGYAAERSIQRYRDELGFEFKLTRGRWWKTSKEVWVEINTLEELLAFVDKWGKIIFTAYDTIEIYDDYRE